MGTTAIVTRQIANLAVTTAKIAANAITLGLMGWGTAKGDLLVAQSSTVYNNLAVGTNGQVLTAASGATNGVQWSTPLSSTNFVYSETPSGTINGSNTTFTLANTPVTGTVCLYANGIRQNAGGSNDYTISTNTITFNAGATPQTGDVLLADYQK